MAKSKGIVFLSLLVMLVCLVYQFQHSPTAQAGEQMASTKFDSVRVASEGLDVRGRAALISDADNNASSLASSTPSQDAVSNEVGLNMSSLWLAPLLSESVPVAPPLSDVKRGVHYGDICSVGSFVKRVGLKQKVRIGVLGSSLSIGVGLEKKDTDAKQSRIRHRYSTLLEQSLNEAFGDQRFEVVNLARGMCSSSCWVNEMHFLFNMEQALDLIVIETIVDAWVEEKNPKAHLAFQDLLLQLLALQLPLLFITAFVTKGGSFGPPHFWDTSTRLQRDLQIAGIPFFSYRDAVWPVRERPPANLLSEYWAGSGKFINVHPGRAAHKWLARGLAQAFLLIMIEYAKNSSMCNASSVHPRMIFGHNSSAEERCVKPVTHMLSDFPDDRSFRPRSTYNISKVIEPVWVYRSDSKEKYGWIGETDEILYNNNSWHIDFEVTLGAKRRLEIAFLRTYENIGGAVLEIHSNKTQKSTLLSKMLLDGMWNSQFSGNGYISYAGSPGPRILKFYLVPIRAMCEFTNMSIPDVFTKWTLGKSISQPWCRALAKRKQKFKILRISTC